MTATIGNGDLLLEERRELTMHGQALLEALLEFDRVNNGWLWRATEHQLRIDTENSPPVVVEARRSDGNEMSRAEFSIGHVAATFIHTCRTLHIPMPRNSRKEVKIAADGATLILHLSAPIPLRHTHNVPAPAAPKKAAPRPAAVEPPADGAEAPDSAAAEPAAEGTAPEAAAGGAASEAVPGDAEAPAPAGAAATAG